MGHIREARRLPASDIPRSDYTFATASCHFCRGSQSNCKLDQVPQPRRRRAGQPARCPLKGLHAHAHYPEFPTCPRLLLASAPDVALAGVATGNDGRKCRDNHVRIVAHDLAGVEDVLRVEDSLELRRNTSIQRAGLLAHEGRAAESAGVFTADASLARHGFPRRALRPAAACARTSSGIGKVQERLHMELAVAGVAKHRGRHLVALQHVLRPHQEIGEHFRRDGACLRPPARDGWVPLTRYKALAAPLSTRCPVASSHFRRLRRLAVPRTPAAFCCHSIAHQMPASRSAHLEGARRRPAPPAKRPRSRRGSTGRNAAPPRGPG